MSSYCPVCNGLNNAVAPCPICAQPAEDLGRFSDFQGPYAPYRATEDINESSNTTARICVHMMSCEACGLSFEAYIHEWPQA